MSVSSEQTNSAKSDEDIIEPGKDVSEPGKDVFESDDGVAASDDGGVVESDGGVASETQQDISEEMMKPPTGTDTASDCERDLPSLFGNTASASVHDSKPSS